MIVVQFLIVLLAISCFTQHCAANFQEGDFIPTARKAQFHGRRTNWHDVLGSHCPRFGVETLTVLPLPEPVGYSDTDDYRIQFSLDSDRVISPWLQIIGRHAPDTPFVDMELVRSGEALVGLTATVRQLSDTDVKHHPQLVEEFHNSTHWPKHLLLRYRWKVRNEVDGDRGLTVMFALSSFVFVLVAISTMRTYSAKLKAFMNDVAGEGHLVTGTTPNRFGLAGDKAE